MTPIRDLGTDGAQSWTFGVAAEGLEILRATTQDTLAAPAPEGLRRGGFERTELASSAAQRGFISAVTLSAVQPITLPTDRASLVCRFVVRGTGPAPQGTVLAKLAYANGLQSTGQAVATTIIRLGMKSTFLAVEKTVIVTSLPAPFRRGDANDDGKVDISDGIYSNGFLFLGGLPPPAPGPVSCGLDPTADALGCQQSAPCQ